MKDLMGRDIPEGKVTRELVANFLDGTMPSWLSLISGTASYILPATGKGGLKLETGAINGDVAQIKSYGIYLGSFLEVSFTVEGFQTDTDTKASIGIGIQDSPRGVGFWQAITSDKLHMRVWGTPSNYEEDIDYRLRGLDAALKSKNITVKILPRKKEIMLLEDDQVMFYYDASEYLITNGVVYCNFEIGTKENVAHYITIPQIKLKLVHN